MPRSSLLRTSLAQDDQDYHHTKYNQRLHKCRLRARSYSLLDLIYSFIRAVLIGTALAFVLRVQLSSKSGSGLQEQDPEENSTNSTSITIQQLNQTPGAWLLQKQNLLTMISAIFVLLQFIGSVALYFGSIYSKPALLRTWIVMNAMAIPFTMYKIIFTSSALCLLEVVMKLIGYVFVHDLIVFIPVKNSYDFEAKEEESDQLPPSIGSCLFGKSCWTVLDECCC